MTGVEVVVVALLALALLSVSRRLRRVEGVRVTRLEPRLLADDLLVGRELLVDPSGRTWVVARVERSTGRGDGDSIRLDLIPNPHPTTKEP